jgi:DNA invertase Pin-like site-specific DNA recombinase
MARRKPAKLSIVDNRRALGIIRVSSGKQAENNSPGTQRDGIKGYSKDAAIDLVRVVEIHESAKDSELRKEYRRVLDEAKNDGILHVVFWHWDRHTRNFTDSEAMERDVKAGIFVLHIGSERKVFDKSSPDSEWLVADINTFQAKGYVRGMSTRAKESLRRKADAGWYPGRPPIGWRNQKLVTADGQVKDRGGTIEPTTWGERLWRELYRWRVERGLSVRAICNAITAHNPPLVPANKLASLANPSRIDDLLKNPFSKGWFWFDGKLYRGKHQAFLSEDEWDKLQATFGRRTPQQQRRHDGLFTTPSLRLHCANEVCGCMVTYAPKWKGERLYRYYHCGDAKKLHDRQVNVTEEDILAQLATAVDEIEISERLASLVADALNENHRRAQVEKDREVATYKAQLTELRARADRAYDVLDAGTIGREEYKRQIDRFRAEEDAVFAKLRRAEKEIDGSYLATAQQILELCKSARILWESRSKIEQRDLLAELLWNPLLDGTKVRYDLKKPFRVVSEMREKEDWRALVDDFRTACIELRAA